MSNPEQLHVEASINYAGVADDKPFFSGPGTR